jgi:putative mRNA 3-end processing factor
MDRGFPLSDHADWDGLHRAIEATGARRIGVTHGYVDAMSRWLSERDHEVTIYRTRFEGEDAGDAAVEAVDP